jgi:hypothetical protein
LPITQWLLQHFILHWLSYSSFLLNYLLGTDTAIMEAGSGLTDQALLAKINKLRELNVGTSVPLPQVSQKCQCLAYIILSNIYNSLLLSEISHLEKALSWKA